MAGGLKRRLWRVGSIAIALLPWLAAMFLFYWLDASGTWSSETAHRGKLSVALLATGMGLSFLIYSYLARRRSK